MTPKSLQNLVHHNIISKKKKAQSLQRDERGSYNVMGFESDKARVFEIM